MHNICLNGLVCFGRSKSTLPFEVPVMSVGWLLCCLLWLFNSILSFFAHAVKMLFIFDVECAGKPSVEELSYSFLANTLFIDL